MKVVEQLQAAGRDVRVIDVILHGQEDLAAQQRENAASTWWSRTSATTTPARQRLQGVDEVVHLAAIVGDPACALDPERSNDVNVEGHEVAARGRRAAGVEKLRLRLDVLELRAHGGPDGARHRGRRARAGLAVRRAEGGNGDRRC